MLIVNPGPYRGRFKDKIVKIVKGGTRVGRMHVSAEDATGFCHVCEKNFKIPTFEKGQPDHFGECPHCKTPFVFEMV